MGQRKIEWLFHPIIEGMLVEELSFFIVTRTMIILDLKGLPEFSSVVKDEIKDQWMPKVNCKFRMKYNGIIKKICQMNISLNFSKFLNTSKFRPNNTNST